MEVGIAQSLKKEIIPLLFEKSVWPPGGAYACLSPLIYINCTEVMQQNEWKENIFSPLISRLNDLQIRKTELVSHVRHDVTLVTFFNIFVV